MRTEPTMMRRLRRLPGAALLLVGGLLGGALVSYADGPAGRGDRARANVADAPLVVPYEGFLMLDEQPFTGMQDLTFVLHAGPDCVDCEVWRERQRVPVHGGRFSVALGSVNRIDAAILDGEKLFLAIEVSGVALSGRQAIEPAPYAVWSAHAADLHAAGDLTVEGAATVGGLAVRGDAHVAGDLALQGTLESPDGRPLLRYEAGGARTILNPNNRNRPSSLEVHSPIVMGGGDPAARRIGRVDRVAGHDGLRLTPTGRDDGLVELRPDGTLVATNGAGLVVARGFHATAEPRAVDANGDALADCGRAPVTAVGLRYGVLDTIIGLTVRCGGP